MFYTIVLVLLSLQCLGQIALAILMFVVAGLVSEMRYPHQERRRK